MDNGRKSANDEGEISLTNEDEVLKRSVNLRCKKLEESNSILENKSNQLNFKNAHRPNNDELYKNSESSNKVRENSIYEDTKNSPPFNISVIMKDMNIYKEDTIGLYPALKVNYKEAERIVIPDVIFLI